MKTKLLIGAVSILFLSACGEEVKSVQWWQEHADEAQKKVTECSSNGNDSENCRNAKDGLFRHKQLTAKSPSFMDAYKKTQNKE
ncbi:TPA: EexN family lipoprotein [Proteus mirabilis]|jgi:hypothetical protein|uniref:EexN family lipoprotein n=3 Tax=Morganellaceae TaxID=1903414 RepID=A0A220DHL5_PRORE|nr:MULTISPECIES: EexN family lipoprotein [Enterobacterales]MBA7799668.1 EexN family lipoprotein [Citrobacter sp. RHBSTW-01065]HAN2841621.1 EexN family lipoprotein [Escherichia coli O25b:H4-ST131]ARV75769.1 hypothetical protein PRE36P2_0350 [Providencia rettgeri]ASF81028.1 hypothetical protein PM64421b_00031 [Proteus mirabilis]AUU37411.1 hypothetical protein MC72_018815 [Proteus mirabilis]